MSVIRVSKCEVTRGMLSGSHVLTLIWKIITGGSFKIVLNLVVLTCTAWINWLGDDGRRRRMDADAFLILLVQSSPEC